MKQNDYLFMTMIFLLMALTGCASGKGAATEASAEEGQTALREAIENQTYYVEVNQMYPMIGSPSTFITDFSVAIKGDMIKSYLPFFGRVYTATYGGDNPLSFESKIEDYHLSFDRNGKASIKLKTASKNDTYNFRIEIYPNGTTSIHVRSNYRDAMAYRGIASDKRR